MIFDEDKRVVFIGAGVMGGTLIAGMLEREIVSPEKIIAAEPNAARRAELESVYGIRTTENNVEAVADAGMLVLAVKPQQLEHALHELRGRADSIALVLSIVAGVKIRDIAEMVENARIVRAMPNTPGQIGEGVSVWTASYEVLDEHKKLAREVLQALGDELYVEEERYLDMATALTGSGPAYIFLFIEAMIDAGVRMGFAHAQAEKLVLQTMRGAVEYALQSGKPPTILRNQVTSPGGTTAAGLFALEKHGLRTAIQEGVWAAYQRAIELGEQED